MPFDPTLPANNSPLDAGEVRDQFNGLKAILDAGNVPVGCVLAYLKSLPGAPALPAGWVECNGQTIGDADSPFNGQVIPNLNGFFLNPHRFLRGSVVSGGTGGAASHVHGLSNLATDAIAVTPGSGALAVNATTASAASTDGESSLPSYYDVVWVMRVK